MRTGVRTAVVAIAALVGVATTAAPALAGTGSRVSAAPDGGAMATCSLPATGDTFASATPAQEDLDPAAVQAALAYADTHLRLSVQIFRNNCEVGEDALDPVTQNIPYQVWSSTKSVVSILTGIAYGQHRLALDDQIGNYLPTGPGWGDPAHRAITIRDLLTETAGIKESLLSEFASIGTDPNIAQEALAQPLVHQPGTFFEYTQRVPDLLAYVVQRAVGEDLQAFAQQYLFGPIGIAANSYFWLRDRSGNTYGYANLFIPPTQFAKLGLLMQNNGNWNGQQIVPTSYIDQVRQPSSTNGCYSLLFWVNGGSSCTSANFPAAQTVDHEMIPSAPSDLFAMVGAFQQNNFMIPSLHMTVTWTGLLGDTTPNFAGLLSASPAASDLYYNFFRLLMRGVKDHHITDPGPYTAPPQDFDINPTNYLDPSVLLTDLAPNPSCNVLACDGTIPLNGLIHNGAAVATSIASLLLPH